MHIISKKKLNKFCEKHADAGKSLNAWYQTATKAKWQNLADVQQVYPQAESVGKFTVFNIKGNHYRLIVDIVYTHQIIYIKYILTHADYDKDDWKNDPYF